MLKPYFEWREPQTDIYDVTFDKLYDDAQNELIDRFSEFCKYEQTIESDMNSAYYIKCGKCSEELEAPTEDELLSLALREGWGISPLTDEVFCEEHLAEEIEKFIRG